VPKQTFEPVTRMKPGNAYTVRELLYEMTAKSDNYATILLLKNINAQLFKQLFTDIGLKDPPETDMNFKISPIDYSKFLRILYNNTYLNARDSEYALSILSESTFRNGILQGLPDNTTVAHKFGEFNDGPYKELHESGIIYLNNSPYLLTIMTEGNRINNMPQVLSGIAKIVSDMAPQLD
ncbi:MAG: serine hydrolase, partial [Flavobacterium sp.]